MKNGLATVLGGKPGLAWDLWSNPLDAWNDVFDRDEFIGNRLLATDERIRRLDDGTTEILLPLPGLSRDNVDVSVSEGKLLVTAKQEDLNGSFVSRLDRSWRLSGDDDPDGISASMENGVLRIAVPKKPKPEPNVRRIDVG